jgi:hypothetical protein
MKRTDLAKKDAERMRNERLAKDSAFGGAAAPALDRREQRERDRALGLVPFAVKLNGDLVQQLQALAKERGTDLNALAAELLHKGLEG